ncbi:sensor histidine kinase [Sutcliffiella horikoshii]|uniref:Sensor histidine kinase n=1 Tax=Sutcliffiella horikoshii TaxID=79883 RepID=A0AA95B6Y8_9BACI|nr:sensor histidine kinase [Sutcliffiella horikoshii]TYS60272.1 sensor histidine kinase [Sutcliffiella horikoshii]
MSILQRQVLWAICISFISFLVIGTVTYFFFPVISLEALWVLKVMDLPYILFLTIVSLGLGILFGLFSGMYWKKQLNNIYEELKAVEQGRSLSEVPGSSIQELASMEEVIGKLHNQIQEQTKISQKIANEKAEDLENRIQEIVSQERNRLARELHDSVSQQLFAASMLMSALTETRGESGTDNNETKQLRLVEEMIHQSQLEMRALLLHLRPVALKGKTLQEGAEELLVELIQKVPMSITWKIERFSIDKGVEDHLFRILQETLSNTLRHSKANAVEVLLIQRENFIILRVVDDGIGFDVEQARAGSYGLQNMHERAVELGGTLKIVSVENEGTRLEVKVPKLDVEEA